MSDHPAEPGEGADDLFGRWLAHHEKPSEDGEAPRPRRVPSSARPSEAVTPVVRASASATLADMKAKAAVDKRDGLGPVTPPSSFGVKRGLPGSAHSGPSGEPDRNFDRGVAELDRPSPVGFEPIIIGSVRKKKDQPEPEKEKGGRLKRLRSRVSHPTDDSDAPTEASVVHDETFSLPPPPVFNTPAASIPPPPVFQARSAPPVAEPERVVEPVVEHVEPTPAPVAEAPAPLPAEPKQKRKIVAYEDMIALAMGAALPATDPDVPIVEVEPDPDPDSGAELEAEPVAVETAPEPVLPGPDTEPEPIEPEPDTEPEPEPIVPESEPEPVLPGPDTEPAPIAEESTPGSDDEAVTDADFIVEPVTETESVLPDPELETPPTPHPVLPEQQDDEVPPMAAVLADPSAPVMPTTKRRLVARPKARPEADEPKRHPLIARATSTPGNGTADAARGMLAAARAAAPVAPVAQPTAPVAVASTVDQAVPIAPPMDMPPVYEFAPLKGGRRLMSLLLLGGLIASAYLDYGAYLSRDPMEMGIAGIVTLTTLVIWGIRAGASVTRLTVRSGQLEIVRQGGRQVFDLTSHYTPIEVVGKAGSKKWKVLFVRRGMAPAIIDSSMVDSKDFMRILGFFRPELVNH